MPPMCLVLEADIPNASVQIKEGSITNKDVVIRGEFQQILLGKLEKQLLQLATVGSRSLLLL